MFYDALIEFLNAVSRLPGCSRALVLRDRLNEVQFKRAAVRAKIKGTKGMIKGTQRAGQKLWREAGVAAAAGPAATPKAAAPTAIHDDPTPTRTLMRLRPGGRSVPDLPAEPLAMPVPAATSEPVALRGSGLNPLVDAGTELLTLAGRLRQTASHADVRRLRVDIAAKLMAFDTRARADGVSHEQVVAARYALCSLLDEVVLTTPWGADSPWGQHSLLSQFHNETWGGEKFFQILDRLLADPARHAQALEFFMLCLALGMQGRYRVAEGGLARLRDVQTTLYDTLRRLRGPAAAELSPHWRGAEPAPAGGRLARVMPLWVVASLTALALLAIYVGFSLRLAGLAEPVYADLARIGRDPGQVMALPAVQRTLSLRELLAQDIRDGRLDVIEQARGSTIEIHGDGLFASGSAELDPALAPLMARIAAALNRFDAPVLVTGHTDDQPLALGRRLRFASNWELSQARAEAVSAVLSRQLERAGRVSAEGRGEAEPLVANDSPAHRAQNRRVDVTLLGASAGAARPALTADAAPTPTNPNLPQRPM